MTVGAVRHATCSLLFAAGLFMLPNAGALQAQLTGDQTTERRGRTGAFLAPGWHPYMAIAPVIPLGRLGELTALGMSGHLGAWLIPSEGSSPGLGIEASYASLSKDTDELLPGRYQIAGASVRFTSKGKQRLFFDWLGAYGSVGAGVYRHGASESTMQTSPGASASLGMLVPVYGLEGFIEARVDHLFSGEILGSGNGLTRAPLMIGVRF